MLEVSDLNEALKKLRSRDFLNISIGILCSDPENVWEEPTMDFITSQGKEYYHSGG